MLTNKARNQKSSVTIISNPICPEVQLYEGTALYSVGWVTEKAVTTLEFLQEANTCGHERLL